MFKGLSGLKKAVKGGFNVVQEQTTSLAGQVVGDPNTSAGHLKDNLKAKVKGVAKETKHAYEGSELEGHAANLEDTKEKAAEVAHNIKHYGAFGEDYLGFADPTKDLRKAVKQKEKAAKKARKAKKKQGGKKEDLFDPENLAKYKAEIEARKRREAEEAKAATGEKESGESDNEEGQKGARPEELNFKVQAASSSDEDENKDKTPARTPSAVTPSKENKDDWRQFLNLSSGVDDLIQKSKSQLEDLKADSYYIKKEPVYKDSTRKAEQERKRKAKKRWVDLDHESFEEWEGEVQPGSDEDDEKDPKSEEEKKDKESGEDEEEPPEEQEQQKPAVPIVQEDPWNKDWSREPAEDSWNQQSRVQEEKSEAKHEENGEENKEKFQTFFKEPSLEVDPDDDEDLFNTAFADDITTGKVKLAVIPDSPTEDDDDLFNTEIAEAVVKKQEQEKKREATKLKFTGLGSVADVLSGKSQGVNNNLIEPTSTRRRKLTPGQIKAKQEEDERKARLAEEEERKRKLAEEGIEEQPTEEQIVPDIKVESEDQKAEEEEKEEEESEDEFDAAFNELAKEAVAKTRLEELEKEFESEDIFDTTKADKVLKLASLLDNPEEKQKQINAANSQVEELDEDAFEDPFDTSAYDHITADVEEELEFESLAARGTRDHTELTGKAIQDAGDSVFGSSSTSKQTKSATSDEGWAAFTADGRPKPPRPTPPVRPKRPPPPPNTLDPADNPSVVIKAPSTESIKSWNCAAAENLLSKVRRGSEVTLEEEEEFDPFDTKEFDEKKEENEEEEEVDPFETGHIEHIIDGVDKEDKEIEKDLELLEKAAKQSIDQADEDKDPFDTDFAAGVLPDKGDPFNTSYVKEDHQKANKKAVEGSEEEEEEDPFDTRIADKVVPPTKKEDEDFDPSSTFKHSVDKQKSIPQDEEVQKVEEVAQPQPEIKVEEEVKPKEEPTKPKEEEKEEEYDPFKTTDAPYKPPPPASRFVDPRIARQRPGSRSPKPPPVKQPSSDDDFDPRA